MDQLCNDTPFHLTRYKAFWPSNCGREEVIVGCATLLVLKLSHYMHISKFLGTHIIPAHISPSTYIIPTHTLPSTYIMYVIQKDGEVREEGWGGESEEGWGGVCEEGIGYTYQQMKMLLPPPPPPPPPPPLVWYPWKHSIG